MAKSNNDLDISVLIATYNRAEVLRETLEAMCRVERDGLAVEFVVVDNNSTDHTREVVESFVGQLPLQYLFEPRPGKSCALNKALDEVDLREIVVFTDDDVTPEADWLNRIVETTDRWAEHDVFGGAVYSVWPDGRPPKWLGAGPKGERWNLAGHGQRLSDKEQVYPPRFLPCGPNLWVRRNIIDKGYRFDESIGPNPKNRIMGSDGSFLHKLRQDGYEFLYTPYPSVGHRIQRELLSPTGIRRRVISVGRGSVRLGGLCHRQLLRRSAFLWCCLRLGALAWAAARYLNPIAYGMRDRGFAARLEAICDIAYNVESFRVFWESGRYGWLSRTAAGKRLRKK